VRPLVSILIPAYNAGPWIDDTIRSALAQTWPHKEIIVVDDGSKDATLARARAFESQGVTVFSQPNQGAATARNQALALSKGDYLQWLDADDLLAPNKISRQLDALGGEPQPRTLLSAAWGTFYYRTSKARFSPTPLWHDLSPLEFTRLKLSEGECFMQTATWLVSRVLTEAAGPWDTSLSYDDDGEYFGRVIKASAGIKFIPESRVYYRVTDAARLSFVGTSPRKLQSAFRAMELQIGYLRAMVDNAETRKACVRYLQRYLFHFYRERPEIVARMDAMAAELGGRLEPPSTRWKYSWIEKLFGWKAAIRAQSFLPGVRASLVKKWDRTLFRLERSTPG
jgi:glycosyltransferase involved in cell wall biosynthesis